MAQSLNDDDNLADAMDRVDDDVLDQAIAELEKIKAERDSKK
jgi:hypothetical protein